jgi:hypothetical protein
MGRRPRPATSLVNEPAVARTWNDSVIAGAGTTALRRDVAATRFLTRAHATPRDQRQSADRMLGGDRGHPVDAECVGPARPFPRPNGSGKCDWRCRRYPPTHRWTRAGRGAEQDACAQPRDRLHVGDPIGGEVRRRTYASGGLGLASHLRTARVRAACTACGVTTTSHAEPAPRSAPESVQAAERVRGPGTVPGRAR